MDEFFVLLAEVPLGIYEQLREGQNNQDDREAFQQIAEVMTELGTSIRFIAVELEMAPKKASSNPGGLRDVEINKLVYKYIGVSSGFLGDFSYRTHHEFYIELDLDIDPNTRPGTTRERFMTILRESPPDVQAAILGGVLRRFPEGSSDLRTKERHDEIRGWISRLRGSPRVESPSLRIASEVVQRALRDSEDLIRSGGPISGLDRGHTALHGYCLALCEEAGIVTGEDVPMTELFKKLSQNHPAFLDRGPRADDVLRMLRALATILDALNPLRNKTSVAHPNKDLLPAPEAMLAINTVRTILHYLDQKTSAQNRETP